MYYYSNISKPPINYIEVIVDLEYIKYYIIYYIIINNNFNNFNNNNFN